MDNVSVCFNEYGPGKENLTKEQCSYLSGRGVTFTPSKKGSFFSKGVNRTAKIPNGSDFDMNAWLQLQKENAQQAQADAQAQAQAQAQASLRAQGSFKPGNGGWVKCATYDEPGCVARNRLAKFENLDWKPCEYLKQNDGKGNIITFDGTNKTETILAKPCEVKRGGKRTKRRKPKRKTRR
jgi:hypothetical protein